MRPLLLSILAGLLICPSDLRAQVLGSPVITWDFADGIPSGFNNGSASGIAAWEYRGPTTVPNNTVCSRGSCGAGTLPIASETWSNGFVIFDSNYWDDNDTQCGGLGTGQDPAPHTAWLETNSFDLSDVSGAVVTWQQQIRIYQATTKLQISIAQGPWTDVFTNVALNSPTAEWKSASITSVAAGQSDVRLRFLFTGTYYHWCIDDITVYVPNTNDMTLNRAKYTQFGSPLLDPLQDMEYDQYPVTMRPPFNFSANVSNIGAATQTDVTLSVKVMNPGNVQIHSAVSASPDVAAGSSANLTISNPWTAPVTLGDYQIIYEIDQVESDENLSNNSDTLDFTISEYTYARDEGPAENFFVPQTAYIDERLEIGNMFEGRVNGLQINSISVAVGEGTEPGTVIQGVIYDVYIDSVLAVTSPYTVNVADINQLGEEILITLPLEEPLPVYTDSIYCAMVGNLDATQPLRVCRSGPAEASTSFVRYPDVPTLFYLLTAPVVRMNIFPDGTTSGCTDANAMNFDPSADEDDGSCDYPGCTIEGSTNYDPDANYDDGSCILAGCTDPEADNYNPFATSDDGSCTYSGCMDPLADNYDPLATTDDGSCQYVGCTDPEADNYDPTANTDDGSCIYSGCTDPEADNYDPQATTDDGSCLYFGCTNPDAENYDPQANVDDGSCIVLGCTDPLADNYNEEATEDDGSCLYLGCMDPEADNYDPTATVDDGSCLYYGCTDPEATNFDPDANFDDGSCLYNFASIALSSNTGCAPFTVTVISQTVTAEEGSCSFEINDVSVGTECVPSFEYTFTEAGVYTITFTYTEGTSTTTDTETVEVFEAAEVPVLASTGDGMLICTNQSIGSFTWMLDGDTYFIGNAPMLNMFNGNTYDNGNYQLLYTNNFGCSAESATQLVITSYFTVGLNEGCEPFTTLFNNLTDEVEGMECTLLINGESFPLAGQAQNLDFDAGTYQLELQCSANGVSDSFSSVITVFETIEPVLSINTGNGTIECSNCSGFDTEWYQNEVLIAENTSSVVISGTNTLYEVVLITDDGCEGTSSQIASGISEEQRTVVTLFPNPANDRIVMTSDLIGDHWAIYDVSGRIIGTGRVLSTQTEIDLSGFSSGIYQLVISGSGGNHSARFSVAR